MFLLAPTHARAEPGGVAAATPVGGGASVTRPAAEVEFHATEPDVSFQIRSGEATVRGMNVDVFSPICVAPCTATLPLGTNRIALSKDGAARVQLSDELTIVGPSRIDA